MDAMVSAMDRAERPIGFFVHHQGRGHARRCEAIIRAMRPRPVTIFTADPSILSDDLDVEVVALPNMIGAPSTTPGLDALTPPERLHCVPLGVEKITDTMAAMVGWAARERPALMVIDVSAEIALLMRLLSVPAIKIRMHGDRNDSFHLAAYDACVGLLAPFDEAIEQADYPAFARSKTCYTGGLCTTVDAVPDKAEARARLGLAADREVIVAVSGGGGTGTPYAPLTMAARARPQTQWITIGPLHREGHETEFANLENRGWVESPLDYIAAADLVVASAGDNTVTEIARVGRPFLCVPEWRYFDEQVAKAREMAASALCHADHLAREPRPMAGSARCSRGGGHRGAAIPVHARRGRQGGRVHRRLGEPSVGRCSGRSSRPRGRRLASRPRAIRRTACRRARGTRRCRPPSAGAGTAMAAASGDQAM